MSDPGLPALAIKDLSVDVKTPTGLRRVVENVSYSVDAGETLCIAGESGSGKSISSLAIMGLLPPSQAKAATGSALLGGRDLLTLPERELRRIRGNEIAMIFQEPMTSLNPVMTVGAQLREVLEVHKGMGGAEADRRALDMLEAVRLSEPRRRLKQYPHELSGGMRQRVMIAMSLLCRPKVLIADEPTTALDVTIQAQILSLMKDLQKEFGTALIMITHDMGVVAEMADRVLVMHHGRTVEQGSAISIFKHPGEAYTQKLLDDLPLIGAMAGTVPEVSSAAKKLQTDSADTPLVKVEGLTVRFDILGGVLRRPVQRVHAVENIGFTMRAGETLSLVGESGCGKSTTGKALLNLVPWRGHIEIAGRDATRAYREDMLSTRERIQMIFQDPYASLNPRMSVGELVGEPLLIHGAASQAEVKDRVAALFRRVGLDPDNVSRHPHEFSGGQRQRICIARALALNPRIIVADESVSALDVTVQAQVLDLMQELQDELGVAYLFISHDMAVVEQISHRVAVMYLGQIVEIGSRQAIFENPQHPYTKALLDAVPIADPERRRDRAQLLDGEIPSPIRPLDYRPELVQLSKVTDDHWVDASAAATVA